MLRSNGRSVPASLAWVQQRCQSSSTGASRKTVGTPDALSRAEFCSWTNAPPPKATIFTAPLRISSRTSCSAACSARRNSGSPESRKICDTVRCSRRSMRSSRSSKVQFRRPARVRPTLVLPAPINPTRNRAVPVSPGWHGSWDCTRTFTPSVLPECLFKRSEFLWFLFCCAFSEVDFTTEAAQDYRGGYCGAPHGTHKSNAFFDRRDGGVLLGLQ